MIRTLAAIVLFCSMDPALAAPKWFDQSHEIFLTRELNSLASSYRDFPLFWWNFLILDGTSSPEDIEQLCVDLSRDARAGIQKLPCHFNVAELKTLTQDWLDDLPLRQPSPPPGGLHQRMQETLQKASLPIGRGLIELLRADPLDSLGDLKAKVEKRMQMDLELQGGVLVDEKSGRRLLPVQFSFSPSDSERTRRFLDTLPGRCSALKGCTSLALFGPHASTSENEMQIRADVHVVTWVGAIALGLLCFFIFLTRRHRLLNLVPLLLFSIGISVWVTVLVFGKIHGITLAFGPGIVGLSMDYGIHSAFLDPRSQKTWRANLVGLLTTIVIMIILGFSSIPLLRQMMFFATFGLCFNYLIFYLILPRWPRFFETGFYNFVPRRWLVLKVLSALLMLSVPLIFLHPVQLGVQHLNFESTETAALRQWFTRMTGTASPYIAIESQDNPLASSASARDWALRVNIPYEGISNYLPEAERQTYNLNSWRTDCGIREKSATANELKFFKPFFESVRCENLHLNTDLERIPAYLKDFHHEGHFVGLFFPKDQTQITELRQRMPQVSTPREIFDSFPRIFYAELLWMVPLAFAGAFLFLWLHYRQFGWSTLATVPFLTGLGCYSLVAFAFDLPVSFISLIGLLMVFGCSLDYGVFVMDFLLFRKGDKPGVWSALTLCAYATITGFAPLVFARHPVLADLGHALLWGTVGTYIGALWGVPGVYSLWARWKTR